MPSHVFSSVWTVFLFNCTQFFGEKKTHARTNTMRQNGRHIIVWPGPKITHRAIVVYHMLAQNDREIVCDIKREGMKKTQQRKDDFLDRNGKIRERRNETHMFECERPMPYEFFLNKNLGRNSSRSSSYSLVPRQWIVYTRISGNEPNNNLRNII